MTDQRARAKALLDALPVVFTCSQYGSIQLCKEAEAECLDTILTALADERRRVWEEAAKLICPYCNDPEWITYDPEGDHISPHTGNMFVCRSHKIRAKAHAGQEG